MAQQLTENLRHIKLSAGETASYTLKHKPAEGTSINVWCIDPSTGTTYQRGVTYGEAGGGYDSHNKFFLKYDGDLTFTIRAVDAINGYRVVYNGDLHTYGIASDKSMVEIFGGMITVSTTAPTSADGNDGDIWITYSAS